MEIKCAYDEMRELSALIPNPKNPNKHPDNQIKLLAKIMKHQGWRSPIVVSSRSGFITKGHGRLAAAQLNRWESAPIDLQDYDNEADEYADMVADNKIAELAESDMSMILSDVLELGPDFDFELLGIPDFKLPEDFESNSDNNKLTMRDRFLIPPFSVLNAREGWWQERKKQWVDLGIKSELGRGGEAMSSYKSQQALDQFRQTKKIF